MFAETVEKLYFCIVVMRTTRTKFIYHLKKEVIMIELTWYQLVDPVDKKTRKWYVRPVQRETFGIKEMAQHMEEHNTPFSAGTIEGILTDFVKCVREQILNGNTVKIDDLAIFKVSVESNGYDTYGNQDKDGKPTAIAKVGEGNAVVRSTKLLAQSTGAMMRDRLNLIAKFGWDTLTQAELDKLKGKDKDESKPGETDPPTDNPEWTPGNPDGPGEIETGDGKEENTQKDWEPVEDAPEEKK